MIVGGRPTIVLETVDPWGESTGTVLYAAAPSWEVVHGTGDAFNPYWGSRQQMDARLACLHQIVKLPPESCEAVRDELDHIVDYEMRHYLKPAAASRPQVYIEAPVQLA